MSYYFMSMFTILSLLTWCTTSADFISLDASLAYKWDRGYPQGCQCIETGVTNADCSVYKCPCICDLTAGSCDYNCCCDPDCSQAQIDHFENINDSCDFGGSAPESENLCYSSNELQKVNPRDPVGGSSTTTNAVDELLCVTKVNREYKGDFYEAPAWRGSSVFQTSEGKKSFDYSDEILTVETDSVYDRNDTIPVFVNTSDGVIVADGFLTLPIADFSGYCNDNNYVQFQVPVDGQVCRRHMGGEQGGDVFRSRCLGGVSTDAYASMLVAATPVDDLLSMRTVSVSVTSVSFASDNDSAPLLDITEAWLANGCSTSFGNNASRDENCQFTSEVSVSSSDLLCFSAVKSAAYTVVHDQTSSSRVANVSLQLVVADIVFLTAAQDFAQTFSVTFANSPDNAVVSADNGNQVPRYRSGNPGYVVGLPILFGSVQGNVVNMSDQGLLVPSLAITTGVAAASDDCLTGENLITAALKFGHDMFSGCASSFNRSALRSFCERSSRPPFLSATQGYIGYFGNADPLDTSQWFRLAAPPAGAAWEWNDATSVCSSMITGINYKFLIGSVGEKANPQHKIISASVEYSFQDVKIRIPVRDDESQQTVVFSVSASFVFKGDQELKGYTPPPPPGLLTVPYDVFYPFIGNSAAGQNNPMLAHALLGIGVYFLAYISMH